MVIGLDGGQKMSKSRGNAIMLKATADETAKLIKTAKTDADRHITYDPDKRPEVANLLRLIALCTKSTPEQVARDIGDGGGGKLKSMLTESLNTYLAPIRERRARFAADPGIVKSVLSRGIAKAREEAQKTLEETLRAMNMYHLG